LRGLRSSFVMEIPSLDALQVRQSTACVDH
jgi:hypothetical protein